MLDVHIEFFKRAVVHQKLDALARGQLALGVLGVDAGLAAAETGVVAALLKLVDDLFHGTPCLARTEYAGRALLAWPRCGANGELSRAARVL